jgi:hypothetical protein
MTLVVSIEDHLGLGRRRNRKCAITELLRARSSSD